MSDTKQGRLVVATNDGYVGENRRIVPCVSKARLYSAKHAKTLAKQYVGGHTVDLSKAVCIQATETGQYASQQSYGKWNGFDLRLDFAAVMSETRANKLIAVIKGRERKLRRSWVLKRYAVLAREAA